MFWIQTAGKGTFGNCWEAWARGRGSIRAVCEYEPVTARSIRDYIKNLLKKLGGKESTLERAVTLYNKALKDVAAKAKAEVEGRLRLPKVRQAAKQASGLKLGGRQYSAAEENDQREKVWKLYEGRNMATDKEIYSPNFLKNLPPTESVYVPNLKTLFSGDGRFSREQVIEKAKENALAHGAEKGGKIYVQNNYTGSDLQVNTESIRHGLKGDKNRLLTNARMSCRIGEIAKNAVPINGLKNDSENPDVDQTYAMVADTHDQDGHEYIVVLTIERQNGNIKDMETLDVIHAMNARNRNGSRAGTKPQGVNPSTTTKISIEDLLKVVNSTHQSLLSKDVYEELNLENPKRAEGYYTGKTQFSAQDSDDGSRQTPGTDALAKLGVRLAGSKGQYHLAEQLLERDKAAREIMKATKKAEKKLKATAKEREFAAGIAAGVYEERDIPSSMDKRTVSTLADYYAAEDSFKVNMLAEVRNRINAQYQAEAEDLLGDVESFKKLSMPALNERTPGRTFRAMFGEKQGKAIFDWLIRPVQMNEAEKTRWHQDQLDRVRAFEDSNGRKRELTREESKLTMLVMEGKAIAAAVADMEKKGEDAGRIKNAAENIRNGQDAGDTAQEFGLKSDERELAQNYARWMDTQELLKSADNKIIETAAKKYAEIFDEFYSAINDFLVAHGYEPIGYIKGYAPHMRWERLGTAEKMKSLLVFFTIFK